LFASFGGILGFFIYIEILDLIGGVSKRDLGLILERKTILGGRKQEKDQKKLQILGVILSMLVFFFPSLVIMNIHRFLSMIRE
jgi:hypothetical protein